MTQWIIETRISPLLSQLAHSKQVAAIATLLQGGIFPTLTGVCNYLSHGELHFIWCLLNGLCYKDERLVQTQSCQHPSQLENTSHPHCAFDCSKVLHNIRACIYGKDSRNAVINMCFSGQVLLTLFRWVVVWKTSMLWVWSGTMLIRVCWELQVELPLLICNPLNPLEITTITRTFWSIFFCLNVFESLWNLLCTSIWMHNFKS